MDVYTATGAKKGSMELPAIMFEAPIRKGLMHLALVRQQSNRRHPIAHVKHRGEIAGSTKKLFQQKGTGRARRGPIRSPLLRGGGKAFGPRNEANFRKEMPKKMRRAALFSCLSLRAKEGAILGLEDYPDEVKTKTCLVLLKKLPVTLGRKITIVLPRRHRGLELSARNLPGVKTLLAAYLNPEDVLGSKNIIFLVEAVKVAEETFLKGPKAPMGPKSAGSDLPAGEALKKEPRVKKNKNKPTSEKQSTAEKVAKKPAKPKRVSAKKSEKTSTTSDTSAPSVPSVTS
ncbi:MAG: 50S ribosomal protein L4 [Candidatus Peribacteraceae bacterium]